MTMRILGALRPASMNVGNTSVGVHNVIPDAGNDGVGVHDFMTNVRNDYASVCRKCLLELES